MYIHIYIYIKGWKKPEEGTHRAVTWQVALERRLLVWGRG